MTGNRRVAMILAGGVMLALGATKASAIPTELLDVKVPFAFRAGNTLLPAGEYRVAESDSGVLLIESKSGEHAAWVAAMPETPTVPRPKQPELIFAKFGNEHYLSNVMAEGSVLGNVEFNVAEPALPAGPHHTGPERVHVQATARAKS